MGVPDFNLALTGLPKMFGNNIYIHKYCRGRQPPGVKILIYMNIFHTAVVYTCMFACTMFKDLIWSMFVCSFFCCLEMLP